MPDSTLTDFLVPSDNGAVGHYRIMRPGQAQAILRSRPVMQWLVKPSYADWRKYNIGKILFNRAMRPEDLKYWKGLRRMLGSVPFVYDVDDALWASPPRSTYSPPPEYIRNLDAMVGLADVLVTSTETLQYEMERRYRRPVRLFPNCLHDNEFAKQIRYRHPSSKLKVLWSGSNTHHPDLEQLIPVVLQTKDRYHWVFKGYTPPALVGAVESLPLTPTFTYMNDIHKIGAHVGIAPLIDNVFNRCKSNLKVLEYSALGMASLASNVGPYIQTSVQTVNKGRPKDWLSALRRFEDEDFRVTSAKIGQDWTRIFSFSNEMRAEQLKSVYHV